MTVGSSIEANNVASLWDVQVECVSTVASTADFLSFVSFDWEEINNVSTSSGDLGNVFIITKTDLSVLESSSVATKVSSFENLTEDVVCDDDTTNLLVVED